jgi:hypothetical protein
MMKPQLGLASVRSFSHYERRSERRGLLLAGEFHFQAPRFGGSFGGDGSSWRRPNFTGLAKEVLRADASRSFRIEAAVLGLITLVAAWPIIMMIHEVIRILQY